MNPFSKSKSILLPAALGVLAACNHGAPVEIPDSEKKLDHLIIEEICYSGSWHAKWGTAYTEDKYIKITNPTEKTFYLDGMALAQSGLSPRKLQNLRAGTDHRNTHFGAYILLQFPGLPGEQKYPVDPGKSVYIAKIAHDHTKPGEDGEESTYCENSYDLSKVDFEWGTVEQIKNEDEFPENPNVPNMLTIYPTEASEQSAPPRLISENGALALIRIPAEVTAQKLLTGDEYIWKTYWTSEEKEGGGGIAGNTGHTHDNDFDPVVFLKIPNEWVVDVVQICPQHEFQWNVVADKLDKGYCSVYTSSSDKRSNPQGFTGKSLRRKHDGKKFVDNNDSTIDFEVVPATLSKTK